MEGKRVNERKYKKQDLRVALELAVLKWILLYLLPTVPVSAVDKEGHRK